MQQAIDFLSQKDKILQDILNNYGQPIIQKREEGFASLCHIILEQQVSIASAKACYLKLQKHFKTITPENIASSKEEELRSCGVSRQKSIYQHSLFE